MPTASPKPPAVCTYCAALFPEEWPRDAIMAQRSLGPVDAARQLLVFTRILHTAELPKRHRRCLADAMDWLRRLRSAARQLRVEGVERELYDLWRRQMKAAHEAILGELDARPAREPVDAEAVRRAVRVAMLSVGWRDFGVSVSPDGQRVRILFDAAQDALRRRGRATFVRRLHDALGADAAEELDVKFLRVEE